MINQSPARGGWSAVQSTGVLLLCRVFTFFCAGQAYSAACAKGMAVAVLMTAGLLLPLLHRTGELTVSERLLPLYRVFALLWAARSLSGLLGLLQAVGSPHPVATVLLLLAALPALTTLPHAAAARAAAVLLFVMGAAFLLLPVSGISTANPVYLYTPGDAGSAFLREFAQAGELGILPLLWMRQQCRPNAAAHSTAAWLTGRGIVLPLVVLLGTVQNGRLQRWEGNPFFLLLARTPLSDALRTDGIWLLLAVVCGVISLTVFLQIAAEPQPLRSTVNRREQCAVLIPLAALTALWHLTPAPDWLFAVCAVLLGIAVPWATVLRRVSRSKLYTQKRAEFPQN